MVMTYFRHPSDIDVCPVSRQQCMIAASVTPCIIIVLDIHCDLVTLTTFHAPMTLSIGIVHFSAAVIAVSVKSCIDIVLGLPSRAHSDPLTLTYFSYSMTLT